MEFDLGSASVLLRRTPHVLNAWLRDLPDEWARQTEGPNTWSPYDVVGHLVHGERTDWIPRARIILEHGESMAFEPFDREAQFRIAGSETLNDRLDLFSGLRAGNLEELDAMGITGQDLARRGRHPEFGVVTLQELLATWVVHDLGHIAQIARAMSKRYSEDAGPWTAYLRVLKD